MKGPDCWKHLTAYRQGLTAAQQKRIDQAVDELKAGVYAHEQGREFFSPDAELSVSERSAIADAKAARALKWDDQIRRLEQDIIECLRAILGERAKAFWNLNEIEPFQKRVEVDACDLLQRTLACVDSRDLPLLNRVFLNGEVEGLVAEWVRKAQLEFPPALPGDMTEGAVAAPTDQDVAIGTMFEGLTPSDIASFHAENVKDAYHNAFAEFAEACDEVFTAELPPDKPCSQLGIRAAVLRLSKHLADLADKYFTKFIAGIDEQVGEGSDAVQTAVWRKAVLQVWAEKLWRDINHAWTIWRNHITSGTNGVFFGSRPLPHDDPEFDVLMAHRKRMRSTLRSIADRHSIPRETLREILSMDEVSRLPIVIDATPVSSTPSGDLTSPPSQDPAAQTKPAQEKPDKGNLELLHDKEFVTLRTACRFGGVKQRAIQAAIAKGRLDPVGKRQNLRISVVSLLRYFPPEKSAH